ncbi:unnamed protein product [Echinostoma caproni]|uniref:Uncharacterized protein n=1 Tax=Echinostoma caproni TaxID=27848 RepID=A0A183AVS4_9TREM|nr:unnamed protein product [Echinostoma caproni]
MVKPEPPSLMHGFDSKPTDDERCRINRSPILSTLMMSPTTAAAAAAATAVANAAALKPIVRTSESTRTTARPAISTHRALRLRRRRLRRTWLGYSHGVRFDRRVQKRYTFKGSCPNRDRRRFVRKLQLSTRNHNAQTNPSRNKRWVSFLVLIKPDVFK